MPRTPPRSRRRTLRVARISALGSTLALVLAAGCQRPATEPSLLQVAPGRYRAAFEAAVRSSAAAGLPAAIRDPRSGIIETEAATAPSLLEPWRQDGATAGERLENTVALRQRRARFEFRRAGEVPAATAADGLTGPDLLDTTGEPTDLTAWDGPVELRVLVFLERVSVVGERRHTWSRRLTTRATVIGPHGEPLPARTWTPVARDPGFEQRLLDAVRRRLEPGEVAAAGP